MVWLVPLLMSLVSSDKVLEYRLSKNFGNTFHDYSENYRDGVNGREIGNDEQDTTPSDRGAYFSGSRSMIFIPEEDRQGEKIEFSAPYSIVLWVNLIHGGFGEDGSDITLINREGSGGDELKLSLSPTMELNVNVVQVDPSNESSGSESSSSNNEDSSQGENSDSNPDFSSDSNPDISSDSNPDSIYDSSSQGQSDESPAFDSEYDSHEDLDSESSHNYESSSGPLLRMRRQLNINRGRILFETGKWTLVRIKIDPESLEILIDEQSQSTSAISSYTEVNQNYMMYVGGSPNKANSMQGYIWSLAVEKNFLKDEYIPTTSLECDASYYEGGEFKCFPTELDIKKNSLGTECIVGCSSCNTFTCLTCKCSVSSCEMSGSQNLCICPAGVTATETTCECPAGTFYDGFKCKTCTLDKCSKCSDDETCALCEDTYELVDGLCKCPTGTYETDEGCLPCLPSCITCKNSLKCLKCDDGYYINSKSACETCSKNCKTCNEEKCLSCSGSYVLMEDGSCKCEDGYEDKGKCFRIRFEASIKVNSKNVVTVTFNETLQSTLTYQDFVIECKDVKNAKIEFKAISKSEYEFHVTSEDDIEAGSIFTVILKNQKLKSKKNSLYYKTDLSVKLFEVNAENPIVESLLSAAKKVVMASFAVTATFGIFGSTSFFWILLNTLQILTYLPLNSTPYTETLIKFFTFMNLLNLFPSISELLGIDINHSDPYLEARRYDIDSNLFLINVDIIVVQFMINVTIILLLVLGMLTLGGSWKARCYRWLQRYRYGYFLRLLTGIYLDFLIFSLVQIRTIPSSDFGIFNTFVALGMIVKTIQAILVSSPVVIFIASFMTKEKILSGNNEEFNLKWGSLFEEFKNNKGFFSTQFYFVFMIRRLIYGFNQVFLNSVHELQNASNIFGTFLTLVYIFKYFQYKEKGTLLCSILGEISILITMVLSLIFLFDVGDDTEEIVEILIMVIVFSCILAQVVICIIASLIGLKDKLCAKKAPVILAPNHVKKSDAGLAVDTSAVYPFNHDNSTNGGIIAR